MLLARDTTLPLRTLSTKSPGREARSLRSRLGPVHPTRRRWLPLPPHYAPVPSTPASTLLPGLQAKPVTRQGERGWREGPLSPPVASRLTAARPGGVSGLGLGLCAWRGPGLSRGLCSGVATRPAGGRARRPRGARWALTGVQAGVAEGALHLRTGGGRLSGCACALPRALREGRRPHPAPPRGLPHGRAQEQGPLYSPATQRAGKLEGAPRRPKPPRARARRALPSRTCATLGLALTQGSSGEAPGSVIAD